MSEIAAGLGDDYAETGATAGRVSRSKKGDGVLSVDGGDIRVVLEMTDSRRTDWGEYLAEAERNRGALASIGIVRFADQLNGHLLRVIGPRRIVLAFDPATDNIDLLRTVVQLVRLAALASARQDDATEVRTAGEKIAEAIAALERIEVIRRLAGIVQGNSKKIIDEADAAQSILSRLLEQARAALTAADAGTSVAA